jgi:Zn-dependent protease
MNRTLDADAIAQAVEGLKGVLIIFIVINVGLFVFNMIPIPPLDGSRLLYAFAPESVQRFMATLEQFGIFIIFFLILCSPCCLPS